jgi:predicted dehydrogenase
MQSDIHVGVLGVGAMGRGVIRWLKTCAGVSGVVGYDIRGEQVRAAGREPGVRTTDRLADVLGDDAVRLVFVTASNEAHKELTIQSLRAGKAVMCEKPMATTLADARAMVEEAEKRNEFLQIGFELRYSKLYTKVKQWIDEGKLGRVVNTHCLYLVSEFHGRNSWRIKKHGGENMFGEKLCHYVDLPRWWTGSAVESVYSVCAPNIVPYFEVRDNFHTTYRFQNGAVSHLTFMMGPPATFKGDPLLNVVDQQKGDGHTLRFFVVGTQGAAETDVFARTLKRWQFGDSPQWMTSEWVENLTWDPKEDHFYFHDTTTQAHDIVRRVRAGLPPMTPARDSYETMKLCFAAEQSADEGRIVRLDELE